MDELFLHKIWQYKLFFSQEIKTSSGKPIEILFVGNTNPDEGPDFLNAKIKIENEILVGSIEIDFLSSNWIKHKHHLHSLYNSVVLHVVWERDKAIQRPDKTDCLTLELKNYVSPNILQSYEKLMTGKEKLLCAGSLAGVSDLDKHTTATRMAVERIESKSQLVADLLSFTEQDWAKTFYILTARSFGLKVNSEPFETLAKSLDLRCFAKYKNNPLKVEALIFGVAGFLEQSKCEDEYFLSLQKEFAHLRQLHKLEVMDAKVWKFMRMRPANFPTIRLAQFAYFIVKSQNLFSKILESETRDIVFLFSNIETHPYWNRHTAFGKESVNRKKKMGTTSVHNLIINSVCPILFVYGKQIDNHEYINKSLSILEHIKAESNNLTRQFEDCAWKPQNALESQGQIQLFNNYCKNKRCLECNIGMKIIQAGRGN